MDDKLTTKTAKVMSLKKLYCSMENFCLNLFRCKKISSKKFLWITYTHENILTTKI